MAFDLTAVLEEWKIDSKYSLETLGTDLYQTPRLHAKYLEIYVYFKAKLSGAEKKHNMMQWRKRSYFRGEFTKEDLEARGWKQWQGLKPSSSELNFLLESDKDMNELRETVDAYRTAVQALEYILKQIGQRDWALKSIIEYQKYLSGASYGKRNC